MPIGAKAKDIDVDSSYGEYKIINASENYYKDLDGKNSY